MRMRAKPGIGIFACALFAFAASATAAPDDNPGYDRPGLGFTPTVLQAGDFTLEQGAPDWGHADGTSAFNGDTLLRLGIGHDVELQLGTGWNWLQAPGFHADGRSDTTLALKYAPAAQDNFSWGLLGSAEFTDGAPAFANPRRQYLLGASFNWQRDASHSISVYAELQGGNTTSQLLAANAGWSLTQNINAYVEAAALHAHGTGSGGLAGAGLAWQATPRVQFDIGARRRILGRGDLWQGGIGVAIYFGH